MDSQALLVLLAMVASCLGFGIAAKCDNQACIGCSLVTQSSGNDIIDAS